MESNNLLPSTPQYHMLPCYSVTTVIWRRKRRNRMRAEREWKSERAGAREEGRFLSLFKVIKFKQRSISRNEEKSAGYQGFIETQCGDRVIQYDQTLFYSPLSLSLSLSSPSSSPFSLPYSILHTPYSILTPSSSQV